MTAGLNVKINVYSMDNLDDDSIGGAILTGTLVGQSLPCRFEQAKPNYLLMQQGIEISKIWTVVLKPYDTDIIERDEIEIVYPVNHPYYGERFRVKTKEYSSHHPSDPRGYLILYVGRREHAHSY